MIPKLEWEQIDSFHTRAMVPGGWLVKAYEETYTKQFDGVPADVGLELRVTMCFLPDHNHLWGIVED